MSAVFPTLEIGNDPAIIERWAQSVECLGFNTIVTFDHVLGAAHDGREPPLWGPYDETDAFHEPLTLLAFLAAVTRRVVLSTGVMVLPQRQTALVAKQAAQVALLSGNRFRLGVGVGWNPVEYEALGQDFAARGARIEEQVELIRQLWSRGLVDHRSRFERINRAGIHPRPTVPIPVWFGGFTGRSLRRASRLGDGFIISPTTPETAEQMVGQLRSDLADVGRDPMAFPIEVGCLWSNGEGLVAEVIEMAKRCGLASVSVNTMTRTARWRGEAHTVALGDCDMHLAAAGAFAEIFRAIDG